MTDPIAHLNAALVDRYAVEREIGAGGMATVYLAEDLKHHRPVAIKVLDPDLAVAVGADRFLREIETAANLTHPHILPLHDSGEAEGLLYYVMPYVDGESLRARLKRERQLPVDDSVQIAREVADALAYAHEQGVVHRDVKPANIMLEAGHAVLADFGVAQALAGADEPKLTQTGMSLGTPSYLSPEQAAGERELDGRSDEYALACVLYEMLVGEPPHTGTTVQAIVAKVLATDPQPISEGRPAVPANVVAAVQKALAKVPADRFAGTREFAEALADPRFALAAVGVADTRNEREKGWRRLAILTTGVAVVLAVVAGVAGLKSMRSSTVGGPGGPSIRVPLTLTGFSGLNSPAALTSDCSALVMYQGDQQFSIRPMNETDARPIHRVIGTPGVQITSIMISPDGLQFAFFRRHSLWTVPIAGGQSVMVAEQVGSNPGWYGGTWGSDGYIYFTPDGVSGIHRVSSRGGELEAVTALDSTRGEVSHRFPQLLPEARGLFFTAWSGTLESAAVALHSLETGVTRVIGPGMSARYAPSGHMVFGRADGSLQATSFDLTGFEPVGRPVTVESGLFVSSFGAVQFEFCDRGMLVYQTSVSTKELLLLGQDGRERPVDRGYDFTAPARFSPDGSRLALNRRSGVRPGDDIWVYDLDHGGARRVTVEGTNWGATWSPDGEYLAFFSDRTGSYSLFKKRADGSGSAELLLESDADQYISDWSADGRWLSYYEGLADGGSDRDAWILPMDGGEPQLLVKTPTRDAGGAFSPDGRYVAYVSEGETWVIDLENRESRVQVSVDGGGSPRWLPGGREIAYGKPGQDRLVAVSVETDPTFKVLGEERVLFDFEGTDYEPNFFGVSPDGSEFILLRRDSWARFELVTNWFDELTEKVGR